MRGLHRYCKACVLVDGNKSMEGHTKKAYAAVAAITGEGGARAATVGIVSEETTATRRTRVRGYDGVFKKSCIATVPQVADPNLGVGPSGI